MPRTYPCVPFVSIVFLRPAAGATVTRDIERKQSHSMPVPPRNQARVTESSARNPPSIGTGNGLPCESPNRRRRINLTLKITVKRSRLIPLAHVGEDSLNFSFLFFFFLRKKRSKRNVDLRRGERSRNPPRPRREFPLPGAVQ